MDISFIIPARNEQDRIGCTIANIQRTVKGCSFEILVIDDASEEPHAKRLGGSPGVVCIRNEERLGVSKSRNIGARAAKGDALLFLDAHVCFLPGWLEELRRVRGLLNNGIVAPAFRMLSSLRHFETIALHSRIPWRERLRALNPAGGTVYGYSMTPLPAPQITANFSRRSRSPFAVPVAGGAGLFVSREHFFKLGCFEDELTGFGGLEDLELSMRCWALGGWVVLAPSILCFHCGRPGPAGAEDGVDYARRPFFHAKYDHCVENALRVLYLHLPEDQFKGLLDLYENHPGFRPDLCALLSEGLKLRKRFIDDRRVRDSDWVLRRLSRA